MNAAGSLVSELALLSRRLAETLQAARPPAGAWDAAAAMTAQLDRLRRRYGDREGERLDNRAMAQALVRFRATGQAADLTGLHYVCLAAGEVAPDGYCLLGDTELRTRLLEQAEIAPLRHNRLRLYRALLRAYWVFPLHAADTPAAARSGWETLRSWLAAHYAAMARRTRRKPAWLVMLGEHLDLFSAEPCARYAQALLRGNNAELQATLDALRIPANSWLKEEAVLAQLRAGAARPDRGFAALLPRLTDIAIGAGELAVSPELARKGIALLLHRWTLNTDYAPQPALFLRALEHLGTPWAARAVWDNVAVDATGKPSGITREMVATWLKDCLIDGFFRCYGSHAAWAELWKKYTPLIDELWLAVGTGAASGDFAACLPYCALANQSSGSGTLVLHLGPRLAVVHGREARVEVCRWTDIPTDTQTQLRAGGRLDSGTLTRLLARLPHVGRMTVRAAHGPEELERELRGLLFGRV